MRFGTRLASVLGGLLFAAGPGCYEELHVAGEIPVEYAWHAVYVDEDSVHVVASGQQPTRPDPLVEVQIPEPVRLPGGTFVALDSLRGLLVYPANGDSSAATWPSGFVAVPGVTELRPDEGNVVTVDNLGNLVTLDVSDPGSAIELSRVRDPRAPIPRPDPTQPPIPAQARTEGRGESVPADYFECPQPDRPGRFLGWRLVEFNTPTTPLCRFR